MTTEPPSGRAPDAAQEGPIMGAVRLVGESLIFWREQAESMERQRNEAFTEVARLTAERDEYRALSHASDLASIRACVAARCLLVPEQAATLLAECEGRGRELEAARECHVEQRQRADRAETDFAAAREALAALREAVNPLMPYLLEMGHPDEPEYPDQAIVMRGSYQWILAGDIRRLRSLLAATRPDEPKGEG